MLLRNLDMQQPSNMLVNGSRGVIVGFRKKEARITAMSPPTSQVRLRGEQECNSTLVFSATLCHI